MTTSNPNDRPDGAHAVNADDTLRNRVVEREKEQFGGIKFGSAFFGWLTATGMAVLLTALVGAIFGTVLGNNAEGGNLTEEALNTATIVSAIVLAVVLFVAYYCGGYVAGRMARFNGAKQGFAVWLWAVIIAIVVAVLGLVLGSQFNVLANVNAFPRLPVDPGTLTTVGIISAIVFAIVALVGAILGGKAGMHYHRKVDKAGLGR